MTSATTMRCTIAAQRATIGETSAVMAFPFTDAQLESHLFWLENAIWRSVVWINDKSTHYFLSSSLE